MKITTPEGTFGSVQEYEERSRQAAERREREDLAIFIALSTWRPETVH